MAQKDSNTFVLNTRWMEDTKLNHCFTTKLGGVSKGELESLNLGFNRGDERVHVLANYQKVCDFLEVTMDTLVLTHQVHETGIAYVDVKDKGNGVLRTNQWESMDGIYTDHKNVTLVTHYADCVPLFFYAPIHGMIGVAHAGWRGTVAGIGSKMIHKWHHEHGIPLEEIEVWIGPSIGSCCFEVHSDVANVFLEKFKNQDFIVEKACNGKYNIDLWACNKYLLVEAGLQAKQIEIANRCTCCENDVFFSHRYTQGRRGTMGGFMVLK